MDSNYVLSNYEMVRLIVWLFMSGFSFCVLLIAIIAYFK